MGTDIHVRVEARDTTSHKGQWRSVDHYHNDTTNNRDGRAARNNIRPIYSTRDYELFSSIAGVPYDTHQIGAGFARGLPPDVSDRVLYDYKNSGVVFSPGYATLAELKRALAEKPTVTVRGLVKREASIRYYSTGEVPTDWCEGGNLPGWVQLEWVQNNNGLISLIQELEKRRDSVFSCGQEADQHEDDIRIVFWFDH